MIGVDLRLGAAPERLDREGASSVRVTFKDKGRALEALERRPATVERLLGSTVEPASPAPETPKDESDVDGLFEGLGL